MLWEYIYRFCTTYLDEISIYSKNLKDLKNHVWKVLLKPREAGVQVDVGKCKICVSQTRFSGLVISRDAINMDAEKFEVLPPLDTPSMNKEGFSFIVFSKFYQRLMNSVLNIVGYLNLLYMEDISFQWTEKFD